MNAIVQQKTQNETTHPARDLEHRGAPFAHFGPQFVEDVALRIATSGRRRALPPSAEPANYAKICF